MESSFYRDTDSFLNATHGDSFKNETILLKGARQFGFEDRSSAAAEVASNCT